MGLKVHRSPKQLKFAFILVLGNFSHSFRFLHYFFFILTKKRVIVKENATLGTPLEILAKQAVRIRGSIRHFEKGKTPSRRRELRRRIYFYLCMITSELFRWYTKLWQLFLLESWAIILTDVVRIREEILPWFQTPWCWIIRRRNSSIGSRKSRHRAA